MIRKTLTIAILSFLLLPGGAWASNGLWTEGKDVSDYKVNQGMKYLTPDAFRNVAEQLNKSVVNISTTQEVKQDVRRFPNPFEDFFGDDLFHRFFNPGKSPKNMPMPVPQPKKRSLGSGFILSSDGYIATNNHVVEKADEITVVLFDETEFKAKVIGRDAKTDVALIKIDAKRKLPHVVLGDSEKLKVGDVVVAIGNPFGFSHSVTQGIVSAKERTIGIVDYDAFIQTDTSINPGNSGGPLLNLQGEVIGINTAIIASAQGIGFAIPINLAKKILLTLKNDGKVSRGRLGVIIDSIPADIAKALKLKGRKGALVREVQKGSPAEKGGIAPGDVIVAFDGKDVKGVQELRFLVADTKPGKRVKVGLVRDGKRKTVRVKVEELTDEDVRKEGRVEEGTDLLGLKVQSLTPEVLKSMGLDPSVKGVLVGQVNPSSPAFGKGVREGDIIMKVDHKEVTSPKQYKKIVTKKKKGDTVLLLVKRGKSSTLFIAFTLE